MSPRIVSGSPHSATLGMPARFSNADALQGSFHPSITADQLHFYFATGTPEIDVADRLSTSSTFGTGHIHNISGTNSNDSAPFILPDGKTLYFSSSRATATSIRIFEAAAFADGGGFDPPAHRTELDGTGMFETAPAV